MARKVRLEIVGLVKTPEFQRAKSVGEGLKYKFPSVFDLNVRALLEVEWDSYISNTGFDDVRWKTRGSSLCIVDGSVLGDEKMLSAHAETHWGFTFFRPRSLYAALAADDYRNHLEHTGHVFVFMNVEIGGQAAGQLLFELFSDLCPKTCQNFKALCTGEAGTSKSELTLSYEGSVFHRVLPHGWVQGGDITPPYRGDGGESIYGPTFEDESFCVSHNKRGILGMSNCGHHSNSSQFYITLQPAPWMDRKYVAFGQLVEGTEVLRKLEDTPTFNQRPISDCRIVECGLFQP